MPKKRKKVKEEKFSSRLITGLGVGFISAATLLALFAFLINSEILDIEASGWIVVVVNAISAFFCGTVVTQRGKGNIIYCGLLPGIIFGFIIDILSIIIDPNAFELNKALKILLISTAGSTIGGIIKLCRSNKKYHRQY